MDWSIDKNRNGSVTLPRKFYETDKMYLRRLKKYEEKFEDMNQTKDNKLALEYIVHFGSGKIEELKKKIHPDLIRDFQLIGYLKS